MLNKNQLHKSWWVYMLKCENNSYYTGYTDNLEERFQEHISGKGAKYTKSFKPLSIAQSWEVLGDKSTAMRIERLIKKLSKKEKEHLILNPDILYQMISLPPTTHK
ncbi:GIY-YIG nuclease family protein [Legionella pneumophila]|uniref:GIY-YIG nuclease family protein n=1 Tax=Legionella pneumophila TaxID=446 RepID=UPI0005B4CAC1|nr:GIY-YIG nuclease family protein [Legionella pneumophila]HAT8863274.1 GIY-YIG nuclease family protein [Legionella pneumophila subsp. pneumophila]MCZ4689279.1 GIY-YIG nuclease family protein [Legionella pneumophila]MDW9185276.1 GIY-YIG nuclease family protein [Legionella pneumophila]HAT2053603.1 GIY-YIG nuclease family protein [Legionella pneumophila]HAT8892784.1 GIY-YIG nuclease family protein [Legionella pneumophila subsp. pneumophila]